MIETDPCSSKSLVGLITGILLTKEDRDNIEKLIRMFDYPFSPSKSHGGIRRGDRISLGYSDCLLIDHGFEPGMSRTSWFGTDKMGREWQVTQPSKPQKGAPIGGTIWYLIDPRTGARQSHPEIKVRQFLELFPRRKPR